MRLASEAPVAPTADLGLAFAQTRWYDAGAHLDLAPLLARDRINLQRDYALMGIEVWCGKTSPC